MDQQQLISPLKGGQIKTESPIEIVLVTYFFKRVRRESNLR